MPMVSRAQNRAMRAAAASPAIADKIGIPQKVARKFVAASHGEKIRNLPERVQHKADGGAVRSAKAFRW